MATVDEEVFDCLCVSGTTVRAVRGQGPVDTVEVVVERGVASAELSDDCGLRAGEVANGLEVLGGWEII